MGSPVDKDLLKALYQEVSVLAQYVLDVDEKVKATLQEFCTKIDAALQDLQRRLDAVEETQKELDGRIAGVVESSEEIIDTVSTLERDNAAVKSRLGNVEEDQASTKHEMQGLKTEVQSLVLEMKSKDAEPSEICQLPNRNEYFSGREQELRTLEEAFGISESLAPKCKVFGVSGLGGCGKTTLAVEYAWRCCSFYTGGIFWISAESEEAFRSTVMDMAFRLKTFRDDFDQCFSSTLATLSERPLPFLLVVDNADELELSNNVLKLVRGNWRQKAKCHIMITTRRKAEDLEEVASVRGGDCVTLGCYNHEERVDFMQKRTNMAAAAVGCEPCRTEEDRDAVNELVDELGGLPLALEQAGSHIKALKFTYSQYLLEFRKRKMKLIQQKKANPSFEVSRERLAVHTTWLMNFEYASKLATDHGLEELTSVMVDLSGYLNPDDIPCDVINQAYTVKENREDVNSIDVVTVLDILTKFSLYQMRSPNALSVHRLVQEVIRSRCTEERRGEVLPLGVRMLDHAFQKVNSPSHILSLGLNPKTDQDVITQDQYSLHTWARLASNAVTLESHVKDYVSTAHDHQAGPHSLFTKENTGVLSQATIYLSMSDQHKQALELQKFMVETLTNIDPTESNFDSVELLKSAVSIPLTKDQQLLLRLCSQKRVTTQSAIRGDQDRENIRATIVQLRLEGNKACAAKEYQRAISSYSEAIKVGDSNHDCKSEDLAVLYCNRCHCYLKLGRPTDALRDAEECVRKNPRSVKGFFRRAIAMKMLFDQGKEEYEMAYLASAAMAKYLDRRVAQEVNQKFGPAVYNASYTVVVSQAEWNKWVRTVLPSPTPQLHVVLLESGTYNLNGHLMLQSNARAVLIGVESVKMRNGVLNTLTSSYHFENIVFDKVNVMALCSTFLSCIGCTFENGRTQQVTKCPIGRGCPGCFVCRSAHYAHEGKLLEGPPSVGVGLKSRAFLIQCTLRNSAGGALSKNDSFLLVRDCKVHDHCLALLEAREGGTLVAEGNLLCNSKFAQGVTLGPKAGPSQIRKNKIHGNVSNGIEVMSESFNITIEENEIYQNGQHGIQANSFTSTEVRSNDVFENWFWGINVVGTSRAQLFENVVHHNKCGGIRLEAIDCKAIAHGNKVSDHNGPGILAGKATVSLWKKYGINLPGEVPSPVMEGNIEVNNVEGQQHPTNKLDSVVSRCAFCHRMPNDKAELKVCGKCRKSSYCSKRCQEEHWTKHRALCKALEERFSVAIDVPPGTRAGDRVFHPDLKGIKKAPKPNRRSTTRLIVKIQTLEEVTCHPKTELVLYDKSTDVDFDFINETIYHIVVQCGVLGCSKLTGKKIFCYAAFEANGRKLRIFLDELAPFQEW